VVSIDLGFKRPGTDRLPESSIDEDGVLSFMREKKGMSVSLLWTRTFETAFRSSCPLLSRDLSRCADIRLAAMREVEERQRNNSKPSKRDVSRNSNQIFGKIKIIKYIH